MPIQSRLKKPIVSSTVIPFLGPRMLSIEKPAEYICVSIDVMRDMVRGRKIPYVPNGRRCTIDRLDLDNWIEKGKEGIFASLNW
jgi:excisionase family DNA binding protein